MQGGRRWLELLCPSCRMSLQQVGYKPIPAQSTWGHWDPSHLRALGVIGTHPTSEHLGSLGPIPPQSTWGHRDPSHLRALGVIGTHPTSEHLGSLGPIPPQSTIGTHPTSEHLGSLGPIPPQSTWGHWDSSQLRVLGVIGSVLSHLCLKCCCPH